jgi:lipopolysaccharide heptosyltransferase I
MPVRDIRLRKPPERIALIKPSALGDIAHSLPVLSALRKRFPEAHISWVVNRGYAPILEQHPDLNAVIPFDRGALRKGWLKGGLEFFRFLRHLRAQRFDMVIDLQGLLRTGLMTLASGAAVRIGLATAREGAMFCYTYRVDDRNGVSHAVDRYWRVIESLGDAPTAKTFHVPIQPEAKLWAHAQLQPYPQPWLAVGVGSRWLTKRWPPEHFAALVRKAQERFGGTAIFVGTPEEASLAEQAASLVPGSTLQLTGKTALPQLVAILSEVDAMIANDTGPLHLAVALGRPVLAPYTCTLIERTGPYGQDDRAIATSIWCRGSYLKTCPRMECMTELTPDRLWPSLETLLRTWQQQHHAA